MDDLDLQFQSWVRTLDGLNQALVLAQQTGNAGMLAQVRGAIQTVLGEMAKLKGQLQAEEAPAATLQALDQLGDRALAVARAAGATVGEPVLAAFGGVARTIALLPVLLVGLLVVVGIGFRQGSLRVRTP